MVRHSGFYEFHSCALCREVSRRELFAKIPSLPLRRGITFFQSLPKIHDHVGEDWNLQMRWKVKVYGVWKLPFCHYRAINLTQSWVCFTYRFLYEFVYIVFRDLWIPPQGTWNSSPAAFVLPLTYIAQWVGFLERHNTYLGVFSDGFLSCSVARSCKPIKCILKTMLRRCYQNESVRKKQTIDPAAPDCDTLLE